MFVNGNNVRTTLFADINDVIDEIWLAPASAPWEDPVDPDGDAASITFIDWSAGPTKIEIVHYTGIAFDTDHWVLTGCTRGAEGSTAQAWTVLEGADVVGATTLSMWSDKADKTADETVTGLWRYQKDYLNLWAATDTDPVRLRWNRENTSGDFLQGLLTVTQEGYARLTLQEMADANFDSISENILRLTLRPGAILRTDYGPSGTDPYEAGLILDHRTGGATWLGDDIWHEGNLPDPAQLGEPNAFTGANSFSADAIFASSIITTSGAAGLNVRDGSDVYGVVLPYVAGPGLHIRVHDGTVGTFTSLLLTQAGGITWGGDIVWTAGSDGASSGLDADLLDGAQGSTYYGEHNWTIFPVERNGLVANTAAGTVPQDNKTALEAAIAEAVSNGGGEVLLPGGAITVDFAGGIDLPRGVKIRGQGTRPWGSPPQYGTALLAADDTAYFFKGPGTGIDNCAFRHFSMEANGHTVGTFIEGNFQRSVFEDLVFYGGESTTAGIGLHILRGVVTNGNRVLDCHFRKCTIGLHNMASDSHIRDNYFNGCGTGQLEEAGGGTDIIGNRYDLSTVCALVLQKPSWAAGGAQIEGNYFDANEISVRILGISSAAFSVGHIIAGNRFNQSVTEDIEINDACKWKISGNQFFGDASGGGPTSNSITFTNVGHGLIHGNAWDPNYTTVLGARTASNIPAVDCYQWPSGTGAGDPVAVT